MIGLSSTMNTRSARGTAPAGRLIGWAAVLIGLGSGCSCNVQRSWRVGYWINPLLSA